MNQSVLVEYNVLFFNILFVYFQKDICIRIDHVNILTLQIIRKIHTNEFWETVDEERHKLINLAWSDIWDNAI